jgi:hypothetical protein
MADMGDLREPPASFGLDDLHPLVHKSSRWLYEDKHYAAAILEAYKLIELRRNDA